MSLKPYPEYKDSGVEWLGEVPSGWAVHSIKLAASTYGGAGFPHEYQGREDEEVPFHKVSALTSADPDGVIRAHQDTVSLEVAKHLRAQVFPSGSIVMAKIGAALLLGRIRLVGHPFCIDNNMMAVIPKENTHPRYLYYALQLVEFERIVNPGAVPSLDMTAFRDYSLPFPSFEVQREIADYLDRETAEIDALIAEQDALLALLTEHRTSFVDSSLCALGSSKVPLKYRGSLSAGLTLGAVYNEPVSVHPYIRVANVQAGRLDLSRIAEVAVPDRVAETRRLYPGDVLMTEGGDRDKLGRGALWSGEVEGALHQNHVFAFRCGPQLDPQFLVYVLESSEARQYFEATASQSTNLASTNSTLVKRLRIPDVSIQMQHAVVETLDNEIRMIEAASEDAYRLIELAEERRSALISAAVTGQIDVTVQGVSAAEQLRDELVVHV